MAEPPLILVIDDDAIVHKLLSTILRKASYRVAGGYSGADGLRLATQMRPDLILLDIMMPEMNGFQVIEQLKVNPDTADIPVFFLSAKIETTDKVKGLKLGAADFVNKPFDRAELMARIQAHLKIKQQEEALREYSQNLEKMVAERTRQLIHADRLASLGTLSAGIAHEINNPTTFITGNLQTLEAFWKKMVHYLETHSQAATDPMIKYIIKEFPAMIQSIRSGADRISNIVSGLKTFSRKDSVVKSLTNLNDCLDEALKLTHNRLKYFVTVKKEMPADLPLVWANTQHMVQVFVNLLLNAGDAIGERPGQIAINGAVIGDSLVRITMSDSGQGMPPEVMAKIFDPFFTTKPIGQGTGLGLSITHGIIQEHGGTIEVSSVRDQGTTFTIILPTEQANG